MSRATSGLLLSPDVGRRGERDRDETTGAPVRRVFFLKQEPQHESVSPRPAACSENGELTEAFLEPRRKHYYTRQG